MRRDDVKRRHEFGDCLAIVAEDEYTRYQVKGESGTLVIRAVDGGDGGCEVTVQGVAVLIAVLPVKIGGRERYISIAMPFDHLLTHLDSLPVMFSSIQLLNATNDATSIANSDIRSTTDRQDEGDPKSQATDGVNENRASEEGPRSNTSNYSGVDQSEAINCLKETVRKLQEEREQLVKELKEKQQIQQESELRCQRLETLLCERELDVYSQAEHVTHSDVHLFPLSKVLRKSIAAESVNDPVQITFEARKHMKQLVYTRTVKQISQSEPIEGVGNHLKQSIYSRQQIQHNKTVQTATVERPVPLRGLVIFHGDHLTTIHSLPYELHEMLLKRSSCLLAKTLLKTDTRPDIQLFNTLSSVCRYFHFILTVRRRRSVWNTAKQQLTVVCRPYRLRPMLLATIVGQCETVLSLCTLDSKLYVNHSNSSTINVYSSRQPYTLLRHIQTPLSIIASIASCSINNWIYVAGADTERLGVVDKVTSGGKVVRWLQNIGNVQTLSVSSDGSVVLLIIANQPDAAKGSETWRGKVEVYSSTGVKMTKLNLPHDIISPWHAVQTANQSFILSHGNDNQKQHRVCEVDNEGFVVASYGGLGELTTPIHFTIDSEERVIVADYGNPRVLLLDRQLNIERVLLTWSHDADKPFSLFYEASERRLFVGFYTGELEIYSL